MTALSGGDTFAEPLMPRAPKTWVYGLLSSNRRKSENMPNARVGMVSFTPRSTAELGTSLATAGNGALTMAEPMNQAMSSTDSTLTAEPPKASTTATGRQVTWDRTAMPISEASNCPTMAVMNTRMIATRACWDDSCTRNVAVLGEKMAPTAAPARNPMQLSTPTMNPCR